MQLADSGTTDAALDGNHKTDNDDTSCNNSEESNRSDDVIATKKSAVKQWQTWVPMYNDDPELHHFVQLAQLCMLQKVDEMFVQSKIPYWICGGTLIGAIRHSGRIPHDDDVDIECFEHDLEKIAEIAVEPPLYTGFVRNSGMWKQRNVVAKLLFFNGQLEVDVFPRPWPLPSGDDHFPSQDQVFPLTRYDFHNIKVWGPNRERCGPYLDKCVMARIDARRFVFGTMTLILVRVPGFILVDKNCPFYNITRLWKWPQLKMLLWQSRQLKPLLSALRVKFLNRFLEKCKKHRMETNDSMESSRSRVSGEKQELSEP